LCELVEQINNTKINLCLIVCNGNGTKLGSNFINTRPNQKVLEIQRTNLMTLNEVVLMNIFFLHEGIDEIHENIFLWFK
jgi:hypothetical protein